ncbi:ClpP family protease [Candidatus Karelsulcia muelleri]|uniref:ATP-dependent Clp protease proteolytic subunit n=1 Tax=Candidatus Karelsulcia muelleri PSPU TaxID=1189303 RepID=A0AAD1B2E3_9FLAO|nr:ATP-dependent Clp protease proteolytic subunit [Candidatus Karelsulcia muelleri]NJJ98824.1 ATP-dependent Clp protease proteolytic subunit [Candidatus Karelsulcia muelleri]BAO66263.1 ATP-dependent Clp protease, proteolytic subunit [Candidatus Karelsulcia muelleri PSPU]
MNFSKEFKKYAISYKKINRSYLNNYIQSMTPYIMEERKSNVFQMDVFSRLMMDRIIFLGTPIDDKIANIVQAQLLFLQSLDSNKDIQIYINSPGGSVYSGLGIYDTMQILKPEISTICTGIAASMAAILLCSGQKGKRSILKHSRVLIHQPIGYAKGQSSDMEITVREILKLKKELNNIISEHTNQPFEKVQKDSDRDYWMTSEEAKNYGIVDEILL